MCRGWVPLWRGGRLTGRLSRSILQSIGRRRTGPGSSSAIVTTRRAARNRGAAGHPAAEPALHGGASDNGGVGGAERTAVAPLPGIVGSAAAGGPAQHDEYDEAGNYGHGLTAAARAIGPVHAGQVGQRSAVIGYPAGWAPPSASSSVVAYGRLASTAWQVAGDAHWRVAARQPVQHHGGPAIEQQRVAWVRCRGQAHHAGGHGAPGGFALDHTGATAFRTTPPPGGAAPPAALPRA